MPRPVGEVACSAWGVVPPSTGPLGCRRVPFGFELGCTTTELGDGWMIFVGDDWAQDHHDVYVMDADGARLASRRLPEGLAGMRGFHELVAAHVEEPGQVVIGIETDRGLWVGALGAAGVSGVRGQPAGSGPLSRPPSGLGREIRCRRRQAAGRSGPHRPPQPPPAGRRQPRGRGDQGPGPGTPEPDLGPHPAHQRAAWRFAGVLPGGAGGVRRSA